MATILVIDDSHACRVSAQLLLTRAGHRVELASNGQAGLEHARQRRPDLVLVALHMPVLDGVGVLARLSCEHDAIPVIVMNGSFDDPTRRQCLDAGAAAILTKPLKAESLLGTIGSVLSLRRVPVAA